MDLNPAYDSNCTVCQGTGIDQLFMSPCTECGPTMTAPRRMPSIVVPYDRSFEGGNHAPSGFERTIELASDKQLGFIASLRRKLGAEGEAIVVPEDLTKKAASALIEKLLGLTERPQPSTEAPAAPAAPARKPNRFGGRCIRCNQWIEAEQGLLTGGPGSWGVEHAECDPHDEREPEKAAQVEPGMYWLTDGRGASVQFNKEGTRLYAKVWNGDKDHSSFDYEQGAMRLLDRRMSVEEAVALSAELHHYAVCGRHLRNKKSIERGIGPICFAKI